MKFYVNVSAKKQSSIECLLKFVLKKNEMMLNGVSLILEECQSRVCCVLKKN